MTSCKCAKCKCVIESINERSNFVCEFCKSGDHIKKKSSVVQ